MKININDIFDNRQSRTSNPRNYDVRITLNKSGTYKRADRFVIRFGFLNEAVKAFFGKDYIQVSKVEALPDRIYFRTSNSRDNLDMHKLLTNSNSKATNLYTTITPSDQAEKIYRAKWINKTFDIQFDSEVGLYYITLESVE